MRILIFGINYAPELTGIGKYTGEMGSWLANQGHEVTAITALPYYPEWEIHDKYKDKWWYTEEVSRVTVQRCPLYVPKKVNAIKRIIHEFSFFLSTAPIWLINIFRKKYDVIICVSPPFHLGILPLIYSKLKGARLITHIQDLQVDAAKDLGMIKNQLALKLMFWLEKILLKNSNAVSTISTGMQKKLVSKGIDISKIILFPNWVDETVIKPLAKEKSLKREFGINDSTQVILYSGNLGEKQGLEIIVEVAKSFEDQTDILFLITGSGGGKDKLINMVADAGLKNVKFFPLQPYERLSSLLATADIHLVLQKKSASDLVMPSKLTAILAAGGCPIVSATPGTSLYEVISEHQLGILIEPESPSALREGIEFALKSNLSGFQKNARLYSEKFLSKDNILKQFEISLKQLSQLVKI
jgi:colanic acid biosynthesis glycosyl transferase WcaI